MAKNKQRTFIWIVVAIIVILGVLTLIFRKKIFKGNKGEEIEKLKRLIEELQEKQATAGLTSEEQRLLEETEETLKTTIKAVAMVTLPDGKKITAKAYADSIYGYMKGKSSLYDTRRATNLIKWMLKMPQNEFKSVWWAFGDRGGENIYEWYKGEINLNEAVAEDLRKRYQKFALN